jgi:hypothetical protein
MRRGSPVDSELPRRLWDFISHNAPLFWHWTTHDPVAFYSFVLSISTIALWFVTWRGLRNQTCETRILQRAYVSVEPGGVRPHVDRPDRVNCYVIFRNVGHLPARNVRWYGKSGRPETHGNGDDDFVPGDLFPGRIVLAPGSLSCQPVGVVSPPRVPSSLSWTRSRAIFATFSLLAHPVREQALARLLPPRIVVHNGFLHAFPGPTSPSQSSI